MIPTLYDAFKRWSKSGSVYIIAESASRFQKQTEVNNPRLKHLGL